MENPQAKRIGNERPGAARSARGPTRCVGVESSSRLAAKYEAKKKASRILAISTGWKEIGPTSTQRRAPLMVVANVGNEGHHEQEADRRSRVR